MANPIISTVAAGDEARAVAVITLAFGTDPAARWTWPDPRQFLEHFPSVVSTFGGKAFAHGTAHCVNGFAGAALWLPPGIGPDEEALSALLQRTGSAGFRKDGAAVFEQMGRHHPREPHWYLPIIGVDPFQQGKGYGAALMQHALAPCDRDQTLAYLESSNPKNIPLYERHGFKVLDTIQVGSSPPIYPMLRTPRR
jgi:ribosomal protein S18 acetylase RimI-like enzyme